MGATDGEELIGAPAWYGQLPTNAPLATWSAQTRPAVSPTTTAGCPSRLATLGDDNAIGLLPSGSVWLHVWLAAKPAECAISSACATGAAGREIVRKTAAAPPIMDAGRMDLGERRLTNLPLALYAGVASRDRCVRDVGSVGGSLKVATWRMPHTY